MRIKGKMYWEIMLVSHYKDHNYGIFLKVHTSDIFPSVYIVGYLSCKGIKNKWKDPMRIKEWLIYNCRSYSFATFRSNTITSRIVYRSEREELNISDLGILKNKFPGHFGFDQI